MLEVRMDGFIPEILLRCFDLELRWGVSTRRPTLRALCSCCSEIQTCWASWLWWVWKRRCKAWWPGASRREIQFFFLVSFLFWGKMFFFLTRKIYVLGDVKGRSLKVFRFVWAVGLLLLSKQLLLRRPVEVQGLLRETLPRELWLMLWDHLMVATEEPSLLFLAALAVLRRWWVTLWEMSWEEVLIIVLGRRQRSKMGDHTIWGCSCSWIAWVRTWSYS